MKIIFYVFKKIAKYFGNKSEFFVVEAMSQMRVSMGLTVRRKTAKNLAVRRKNERILAVSRKKN